MSYQSTVMNFPRIPAYFSGVLLVTCAALAWSTAGVFTRVIPLDNWTLLEKPSHSATISSLMALVGVVIMVGLAAEGGLVGDVLALGMTICLAAMMIITRMYPGIPILPAACLSALLSAAVALPFSDPFSVSQGQWVWLVLFGVVNSALGLVLFIVGAKLLPAIETALITALDAPLAPIWVWILFSETPEVATLLGGAIVFFSVGKYLVRASGSIASG